MFDKFRGTRPDHEDRMLPIKAAATRYGAYLLIGLISLWALSLIVMLYPQLFIAIGAAAAGIWYYRRYGMALPKGISQELEARKAAKAAAPPAEKPTLKAPAGHITRPANRDRQIGSGK